jgi:N-acetylmuramoyl-L-alanine amidase
VFKLRFLAGLLVLLAGCSTARHEGKANYSEEVFTEPAMETEHLTEVAPLAPPPGSTPAPFTPPSARATNTWVSLARWSDQNKAGAVQRLTVGAVPTFAMKAPNGLLIIRVHDLVAYWNGLEFHLGFPPQLFNDQLVVSSLDITKNIEPLLHPSALPPQASRVIVIDPGHGGSNFGTRNVLDGSNEKEFALDWAKRLATLLATNGWKVYLTRSNDTDISLSNRVSFAEACKADLFVSLHFNAAATPGDHDESGIETFCTTPSGMPSTLTREYGDDSTMIFPNNRFDIDNFKYAMRIQKSLLKVTSARDHGVRRARFMGVLRGQNRPAVLVEGGYLSNPREAKRIADPGYRQKLAEAVAAALVEPPTIRTPQSTVEIKATATTNLSTP